MEVRKVYTHVGSDNCELAVLPSGPTRLSEWYLQGPR